MNNLINRYKIESDQNWRSWVGKIPSIKFDTQWEIKIIPPFGGAMARFIVLNGDRAVSVYLDCFDVLGCFGSPYWEVHPYCDNVGRCEINDTDELLKMIRVSLSQQDDGVK